MLMLIKRFRGSVVKRMRRVPGGILLTFLGRTAGTRGKQLLISQAEWEEFGSKNYERKTSRALLRQRQQAE